MNFTERCTIKKQLNNRLKSDGYWNDYNALRASLKQSGVPEGEAWRVAAFPFPPKNGSGAEILADPLYAMIAADWANGKYTLPEESTAGEKPAEIASEAINGADKWRAEFEKLAEKVAGRKASELEVTRWVIETYLINVKRIDPDDVPSAGAVGILMWVQMSPSNFGDFLRTNLPKLLPDKRELEYQNKFYDDGRDLKLLEEFEKMFALEQAAEAEKNGIKIHAD